MVILKCKQGAVVELREKRKDEQMNADRAKYLMELKRQNESLVELQETLRDITSFSKTQQTTITCLKDELSAVRLMAAETQLRQLNELKTLTGENKELKEVLTALIRQQQQPITDKNHHGMYFNISCLLVSVYMYVS